MSYQSTIRASVQSVVEGLGLSFLCETWQRANVVLDKYYRSSNGEVVGEPSLPAVLLTQPVEGSLNVSARFDTYTDAVRCTLDFLQAMPLDFTGEDVERIGDELKAYAAQFISNANASGHFERIDGEQPYNILFDQADANLMIFRLNLSLKESVGQCVVAND